MVCDTDDGGRVHASAQFGKYRGTGAEPPPDRDEENRAEVLFIVFISCVSKALGLVEIPILYCLASVFGYADVGSRRHRMNANVGSEVDSGKQPQPSTDVFLIKPERVVREQN